MRAAQLFSGKYFVSALFEVGLPGIALLAIVLLGISVSTPVYSQALQNEIAQDVPAKTEQIDNPEPASDDSLENEGWDDNSWGNEGWSDDNWDSEDWGEQDNSATAYTLSGFVELAAGNRVATDAAIDASSTLRDARVQLRADYALAASKLSFRGDAWYDGVKHQREFQIRELAWQGNLAALGQWGNAFDLKIGQQVLTWGTGDYVFLNDLFPKDYQSFFSGRDDEYLKAPSASIKLSGYWEAINIDVVVTPEFEPDIGITGEVFSFFSPQADENIAPAYTVSNENTPSGSEVALRAHRTFSSSIGSIEAALYGYRGYTKQPTAVDELGAPRYSRLNAICASVVMPLGKGIANAEYAYYRSVEDSEGTDPSVSNSQSRFLLGYSQEVMANVTGAVQWYTEAIQHHDSLLTHSLYPEYEQEAYRHWVTGRITWQAWRQTLTINSFLFYSPTDNDGYLKASASYSPTDKWQVRGGVNLFSGEETHTFFAQFEDASNVYFAFRYFY